MATTAGPILVISPHLDDAVLSCGEQLAQRPGSTVATVCGGRPPYGATLSEWDADCGFDPEDDVMAIRLGEDLAALEVLGARQVVLPERDAQYHPLPGRRTRVIRALADVLDLIDPEECAIPIGIGHPDHILARTCCLALADCHPRISWRAYTDLPYGETPRFSPAIRSAREAIASTGFILESLRGSGDEAARSLKRRAVACYPSQLRGLTSSRTNFSLPEQAVNESHFKITAPLHGISTRSSVGAIRRPSDHRSR